MVYHQTKPTFQGSIYLTLDNWGSFFKAIHAQLHLMLIALRRGAAYNKNNVFAGETVRAKPDGLFHGHNLIP